MKYVTLCILLITTLFCSCDSDDDKTPPTGTDAAIVLNFRAMYEGIDMHLYTRYNNAHDCTFEVSMFKFYLSNIELHRENGERTLLSQIELIDFREHKHSLEYQIDGGSYTAISFDLGVPVALNGTQNPDFLTSVYSLDHPLSASNGTYWVWQSGYRFFMTEGRFDTTINSGLETLPTTYSFHTGRDTLFRQVGTFNRNISGASGAHNHLQFALDFEKFWASPTDTVNLRLDRDFHGSPQQMALGHRLANNSASMFRLMP